jgi:hypothetical protein
MRLVGNEERIVEGLIKVPKLFETFAESDEDPGILIDSVIHRRRGVRHPPHISQALSNEPVGTPPRTLNHGPPAVIKNAGQQHFSRKACLYSEVTHGISKMDAKLYPPKRKSKSVSYETHLGSGVAAAFPDLSLQINKCIRNVKFLKFHHVTPSCLVRISLSVNVDIQDVGQTSA